MIRYALRCADGHAFEAWFQSGDAFDALQRAGHVACAVCGGTSVEKALMAPKLPRKGDAPAAAQEPPRNAPAKGELRKPAHPLEKALRELRAKVESTATYVGGSFAKEARAQHLGDAVERPIWGEANPQEAKSLIEDGVPIAPMPFRPKAKAN